MIKMIKLFLALKAGSYDKIMDFLLPLIFENPVTISWLGKNKRVIGFVVTILSAALQQVPEMFPDWGYNKQLTAYWGIISGLILQAIGGIHAASKERRNLDL